MGGSRQSRVPHVVCTGTTAALALACIAAGAAGPASAAPHAALVEAVATVQGGVIHTTHERYAAFDLDWWHGSGSGGDWGNASVLYIDLASQRLRNLVSAVSPPMIRVGGSMDNIAKYQLGGMAAAECNAPTKFRGSPTSLCMTKQRLDAVLDFFNATGAGFVWGLPYFTNEVTGAWNASNVEALLGHMAARGATPVGLELGEEMAPDPAKKSTSYPALVAAYGELAAMAKRVWPVETPIVLGPSVGMADETEHSPFFAAFVNATVKAGSVQAVNMHSYNNDGGWPSPGFLQMTARQAETVQAIARAASPPVPVWCGECGPHNGGGKANVTDRAVSSFWYLDALGGLARMGVAEFGRQALAGSHYGMLEETTHVPNPDYWVLYAFKRLMGPHVLNVSLDSATAAAGTLHAYAHCAPAPAEASEPRTPSAAGAGGKATLAFVNISPNVTYSLRVSARARRAPGGASAGGGAAAQGVYLFTFPSGLLSIEVSVNGVAMRLDGDSVPPLPPAAAVGSGGEVTVPPQTLGFVTLAAPVAGCA